VLDARIVDADFGRAQCGRSNQPLQKVEVSRFFVEVVSGFQLRL
jgi:hypothetical protein